MIMLIINSYFTILLSVAIGSLIIFIFGLYLIFSYLIFKKTSSVKLIHETSASTASTADEKLTTIFKANYSMGDISAIAGDDVITTQLDLARAYIEADSMQLAKIDPGACCRARKRCATARSSAIDELSVSYAYCSWY